MSQLQAATENRGPELAVSRLSVATDQPAPGGGMGEDALPHSSHPDDALAGFGQSVVNAEPVVLANLVPADLESLENALARLMQRFGETREDLIDRVSQFGIIELLAAAGLAVVAFEVIRRWEQRKQAANSQLSRSFSRLPGRLYLPGRDRANSQGTGVTADSSALT
jgi:hypothetical protein